MIRWRSGRYVEQWGTVALISQVWGWVAALVALIVFGALLGAALVPGVFFWLIFEGG